MYRNSSTAASKRIESAKGKVSKGPLSRNNVASPVSVGTSKDRRNIKSAASNVRPNAISPTRLARQSHGANTSSNSIENIVYDYLLKRNMHKTLEVFKDEVHKVPQSDGELNLNLESSLLDV